jgi:hypothetical protein
VDRLGHRIPMPTCRNRDRKSLTARTVAAMSVVLLASGCGRARASAKSSVPAEFRAACGHPGAHVRVRKVPVTVRHSACDLTGVLLTYKNYGGAYVTIKAGGIGNSSGFTLTVDPRTQDVTVTVTGGPSND